MKIDLFYKKFSFILALLVILFGVVVLFGWWLNISMLIQVFPTLAPMQFNTALLFVFSGLGILGAMKVRPAVGMVLGGFVVLFALASFFQYIFGVNFGIDEFFHKAQITTRTTHPGRMAPNTAGGFILCGLGIFIFQLKNMQAHMWVASCLGVLAFSFGFVSFTGYIASLEYAYGWEKLTDMALHTSVCFMLLGLSIFLSTLTTDMEERLSSWVIIPVMIACLTITFLLWRAIEVQRIKVIQSGELFEPNMLIVIIIIAMILLTLYMMKQCIDMTMILEKSKFESEVTNQTKTVILRYVSHEIRNPLNAVIGFSEPFLESQDLQGEVKEAMDCIYTASIHMKSVVDDLLAVSRFDSGKIQLDVHEFIFKPWFQNIARAMRKRAEKQSIQFESHFPDNAPEKLKGDSSKIAQIIINLVENAFKYTYQQGKVELSLWIEGEELNIKVQDNGRGINASAQQEIFQPFFQVQSGDMKVGLGLGLSICKRYIEMMGGSIVLQSKEGEGTTFTVKIRANIE